MTFKAINPMNFKEIKKSQRFCYTFGACGQSPPSLNKRKATYSGSGGRPLGSGGGPLGRAKFQNIASRLRETPTFEKTRVSPRQNPYFRSGRPSLSPAQAQRAKKKLQNASVFYFFWASQTPQAATGSNGPPWAPKEWKK